VRRIRSVFLLLAVVLLVPMGLLVQRALESVALERRVSHRAVAERLVDEMERELSRFLRSEEERPIDDEHFSSGGAPEEAADAVAIGWFEADSDAAVAMPRKPDAAAEAFDDLVARGLQRSAAPMPASEASAEQVPGTTRELEEGKQEFAAPLAMAAKDSADKKKVSPYAALQSLNKGARMRSERQVKRAEPEAPPRGTPAESDAGSFLAPGRSDVVAARRVRALAAAPARRPAIAMDAADVDLAEAGVAAAEVDEVLQAESAIEVHPMEGRLIDSEHLLLFRRVESGDRSTRQGLVVSLPALYARLDERVVGEGELAAFVERRYFVQGAEPAWHGDSDEYLYRHRFAEPFDAINVRLVLTPLPDVGEAGFVYALAALLLVTGTLGLYAVYRMVAVTVGFAERRSNFVAAVTHELKTPLTAIRMYSEMLRDGMVADEDKRLDYYSTITAESERLSRLIDNVLEFSRLEQGTRETSLVVGAIGPVVCEAAALLEPHAREVGFRIDVAVDDGLPAVRFDRDAVVQVVFNLVDNALKYARGSSDRVVAIRCERAGEGVSLRVRDHGPGVPARHESRIFEPFYRGQDELTRTAKGTGIGLALVKGLADTMGAGVVGRNVAGGGFEVALTFRAAAVV
jgi:signal transduction histidine kinase